MIEISKSKTIYSPFLSSDVANLNSSVVNSYFPVSATVWITVAYVVIFVFGFFGNICIIYIVVSRKQMRTKFNFLVVNMAVGDLLVSLFAMPFEVSVIHCLVSLCKKLSLTSSSVTHFLFPTLLGRVVIEKPFLNTSLSL